MRRRKFIIYLLIIYFIKNYSNILDRIKKRSIIIIMRKAKQYIDRHTTGEFRLLELHEAIAGQRYSLKYTLRILTAEAEKALGQNAVPQDIDKVVARTAEALYNANTIEPGSSLPDWNRFCFDVAGGQPLKDEVRRDFPNSPFARSS